MAKKQVNREDNNVVFLNGKKLFMNRIYNKLIDNDEVIIKRPLIRKNGLLEELFSFLFESDKLEVIINSKPDVKEVEKENPETKEKYTVTYKDLVIRVKKSANP